MSAPTGEIFSAGRDGLGLEIECSYDVGVDGQEEFDALGLRLFERLFGGVDLVGFGERVADLLALGEREGVGHGAADEDGVGLVEQAVDDFDFIGNFGAAEDDDEGTLGVFEFVAEIF